MGQIDNIVDVQISRQTTQVDITAFDIPLILVEMSADDEIIFTDRVRTYTSLEAVAGDFNVTHNAYKMAEKLLGGERKPSTFKIGKKKTGETYVEAMFAVKDLDDTWYALMMDNHEDTNINNMANAIQGQKKTYFTSTSNQNAFNQSQDVVYTATVKVDGEYVDDDVLGVRIAGENYEGIYDEGGFKNFQYTGQGQGHFGGEFNFDSTTKTLTVTDPTMAFTIVKAYTKVEDDDDNEVVIEIPSENISVTDPVGMDIGQRLKFKSMFRTIVLFSATADSEFPECAWVGDQIVAVPGSNSWEYKKLIGVTVSHLTDSQIFILESRNYNYYIPVKGVNITRRGVSADKEWVD